MRPQAMSALLDAARCACTTNSSNSICVAAVQQRGLCARLHAGVLGCNISSAPPMHAAQCRCMCAFLGRWPCAHGNQLAASGLGQADSEKPSRAVHNPVTGGYVSQALAMSITLIRFARRKSRAAHVPFKAQQTQVSVNHNRTSAACPISSGCSPPALAPVRHGLVNLV